jgi:WD40 repeat protein
VASVGSSVEGISLSSDGETLFASATNGIIHSWKVRGLKKLESLKVDRSAAFSARSFLYQPRHRAKGYRILITSSREQMIKFWCAQRVSFANDEKDIFGEPLMVLGQDGMPVIDSSEEAEKLKNSPEPILARSPIFENPQTILEIARKTPRLWAAEKTGNLLSFNASRLFETAKWRSLVYKKCKQ